MFLLYVTTALRTKHCILSLLYSLQLLFVEYFDGFHRQPIFSSLKVILIVNIYFLCCNTKYIFFEGVFSITIRGTSFINRSMKLFPVNKLQ